MQKRGVKLNASRIGKDNDGFEDLDQFWDAAGEFKARKKCPTNPPAGLLLNVAAHFLLFLSHTDTNTTVRTSVASSRLSDADSLNYEDTGSISENDDDTEEEESAFTPAGRGGGGVPKGGRESMASIRTSDDSALPFEDTPASVASISPFPTSASPVRSGFGSVAVAGGSKKSPSPASGGRDGARGRAAIPVDGASSSSSSSSSSSVGRSVGALGALNLGSGSGSGSGRGAKATQAAAPTYNNNNDDDDHDHEDDYGGGAGAGDDDYGAEMMDYDEEDSSAAAGSKKGGNGNRRVSFGQGTKSPVRGGAGKGNAGRGGGKGRGSSSSSHTPESTAAYSNSTTPESGATVASSSATDRRSSIGSVRSMAISTPGSHEFTRGRQVPDDSFVDGEDDEEEEEEEEDDTDGDEDSQIDRSFIEKLKKRKPQVEEDDEEGEGSRRSKRATKGKSFQWWKGERVVYDQGQMIGVLTANPTPAKPKTKKPPRPKTSAGVKDHKSKGPRSHRDEGDEEAEFDFDGANASAIKISKAKPPKIPKELASQLIPREVGDELQVWDDGTDAARTLKVVCYTESLHPPSALPITAERPPGKDGVGFAAQSFNIPEIAGVMSGWISGFVELPAGAIKDAEGVGECAQVFFMSDCQDGAGTCVCPFVFSLSVPYLPPTPLLPKPVELGIADPSEPEWRDPVAQRQLLKKGDSFYVPPGNIYRLENHSSSKAATVHWCIIKPLDTMTVGAGGGMDLNQDQ